MAHSSFFQDLGHPILTILQSVLADDHHLFECIPNAQCFDYTGMLAVVTASEREQEECTCDLPGLANTMCSLYGLGFYICLPNRFTENDTRGGYQISTGRRRMNKESGEKEEERTIHEHHV